MDIADQSNDKGELLIYKLLHVVFASVKVYLNYYNIYICYISTREGQWVNDGARQG